MPLGVRGRSPTGRPEHSRAASLPANGHGAAGGAAETPYLCSRGR